MINLHTCTVLVTFIHILRYNPNSVRFSFSNLAEETTFSGLLQELLDRVYGLTHII